jgi:hypothetical protein
MSETEMKPAARAARLAQMVLTELVADAPVYSIGLDELNSQLKEACAEVGVEVLTVMQSVSQQMCKSLVGFEARLARRAAGR